MKVRWVKQRLHKELDDVREEEDNIGDGLALDFEVDSDSVVHVIQPKGYPTTARAPYWDLYKPVCSTFHALDCRSLFKCLIILISTADEQVFGEFWQ